jgi:hypothetical protein
MRLPLNAGEIVSDNGQLDTQIKTVSSVLANHHFQHVRNGSWIKNVADTRIDVHLEPRNRTLVINQLRNDTAAKKITIHVDLLETDSAEWEKVLCCFDA